MKSPEIDAWFRGYDNPQVEVLLYLREVILDSDSRIQRASSGKVRLSPSRATSPVSIPDRENTQVSCFTREPKSPGTSPTSKAAARPQDT